MVVKLMKFANTSAPIRIMNSMEVVRADSSSTSRSTPQRGTGARANTNAPNAPIPAPSVAVKIPA